MPKPYHTPRSERDDAAADVREQDACEVCGRIIGPHLLYGGPDDSFCTPCLRKREETERAEYAYGSTGTYLDDTEEL